MCKDNGLEGIQNPEVRRKQSVQNSVVSVVDYKSQNGQNRRQGKGGIAYCQNRPSSEECVP